MHREMRFIINNYIKINLYKPNEHLKLWLNYRNYSVTAQNATSSPKTISNITDESQQGSKQEGVSGEATTAPEQRSLHVAVIGVPNAGKSTFINNLINHRVCPTSNKVHTTRKANKAICTTGNTQLVLYDTPGLVTQREIKKHHLEQSFKSAYRHAIQHADLIAVMHDISNSWTRGALHSTVLDTLKAYPALPSVLILNKIDTLKSKRILLDLIKALTNNSLSGNGYNIRKYQKQQKSAKSLQDSLFGDNDKDNKAKTRGFEDLKRQETSWSNFRDVFLVSSITGNGLSDLHDYFIHSAKQRQWVYPSEKFTDERPEDLIVDSVRARLLDYLPQEIPYNLESVIEYYSQENNTIYASVQVICPSPRIERLICGESNGKLRQITERVTSDLVETFGQAISLTLSTKAKNERKE